MAGPEVQAHSQNAKTQQSNTVGMLIGKVLSERPDLGNGSGLRLLHGINLLTHSSRMEKAGLQSSTLDEAHVAEPSPHPNEVWTEPDSPPSSTPAVGCETDPSCETDVETDVGANPDSPMKDLTEKEINTSPAALLQLAKDLEDGEAVSPEVLAAYLKAAARHIENTEGVLRGVVGFLKPQVALSGNTTHSGIRLAD